MTTLTVGEGRTSSLGFVGDWPGSVTPAEYNGEIILSASASLLTILSADDNKYYEYTGSFKYTNASPVGMAMTEVGLSGSVTGADQYSYSNSLADKKLLLSFKNLTLTMLQLYEAGESGDSLLTLFNGNDTITGTNFNNGDNDDGLGNNIKGDVIRAGNGHDVIYGEDGDDSLWGERGNDSLFGDRGNDQLYGGAGNDVLEGGAGTDTLNGGSGNDTYSINMSNFVAEHNKTTVVDGQGTADILNLIELEDDPDNYDSVPVRVNDGKDLIVIYYNTQDTGDIFSTASAYLWIKDLYKLNSKGNGFVNNLETLNTFERSSPAVDAMSALTGAKATFSFNLAGFSYNAHSLYGTAKNDLMFGYNNQDNLYGGAGNDSLMNITASVSGSATLNGGAGNDKILDSDAASTLIGGLGVDTLTGSGGNDTYKFETIKDSGITPTTADVIGNDGEITWNSGDKIDLSAIDANAKIASDQAFTFWSSASANSVWFDSSTSTVFADASGDSKADFAVIVIGVGSMSAADFIL